MSGLTIHYDEHSPNHFSVSGRLTHDTCMQFVNDLTLDTLTHSFVINIQGLDEIDGCGVGVLATLAICLQHQRKELVIVAQMDKQPGRMLKHLGILKLLGV